MLCERRAQVTFSIFCKTNMTVVPIVRWEHEQSLFVLLQFIQTMCESSERLHPSNAVTLPRKKEIDLEPPSGLLALEIICAVIRTVSFARVQLKPRSRRMCRVKVRFREESAEPQISGQAANVKCV